MKDSKLNFFKILLYIFYIASLVLFGFKGEFGRIAMVVVSIVILFVIDRLYVNGFYIIDKSLYVVINLFILGAFVLGSSYNFYDKIKFYDDFLHFWSGFIAVKIGFNILEFLSIDSVLNKMLFFVVLFFFAMGFAPVCEIYEYIADVFFGGNTQPGGLKDTMMDMIDAFAGVTIMLIYYYNKIDYTSVDIYEE